VEAWERVRFVPGKLVAVELPAGPTWRHLLERVWTDGGTLLPLDHRLSAQIRARLLAAARPSALLRPDGLEPLPNPAPTDPEVALVVPTWGTTGRPKLVELSRTAVSSAVRASASAIGASGRDPWLCCLPLSHIGGLLVVLRGLLLGALVEIHPSFDVARVAAEERAAFASFVPTMLARLIDAGVDLRRYRGILIGGSGLDPAVRSRAEAAGARVVATYGLTESTGGVVYDGRPLEGVGVRIGPNHEVQLSGPTLLSRYRLDPGATVAVLSSDGWLRTRDAGELGGDGRLRILGRLDQVINTGGEKVAPATVETVLLAHPLVAAVSVIGRPDPELGERVVALVVPADPERPPMLDEVRAFALDRLPRPAVPRELRIVDALPSTGADQVRRRRSERARE
jgi:O-succinylbenzoic acid--CoA ligase